MAGLASASLDVEREPSGAVAAHLRFGGFGEQRADLVPHARIGGGIGPRRAADWILIHMDHLVALVEPLHARMLAWHDARAVELVGQHRVQDGVHQRGLAGAGDAGHAGEHAQREGHGEVLQIVLARAHHLELLGTMHLASGLRHRDAATARDVVAGHRPRRLDQLGGRAGVDDLAAVLAGAGADIDQPVRLLDGLLVVFDHDQRVAEVAQMVQRLDQAFVVALVQADRRFVKHIHDADQSRADLRGQTDALRLAAGERLGGAGQRQIVQTHVVEESQTGADLLEHLPRDLRGRSLQFKRVDPCEALLGGHVAHVRNRLASHGDGQHLGAQAPALAGLARHLTHVRLVVLLHLVGVGLLVAAHQRAHHAFESGRIFTQTTPPVTVRDLDLEVAAIHDGLPHILRQLAPRRIQVEAHLVAEAFQHMPIVVAGALGQPPRLDGALVDCLVRIGNHQLRVDLQTVADAGAFRAGAVWGVERERARLDLVEFQLVAVRTRAFLRERLAAVRVLLVQIHEIGHDDAFGQA